MTQKKPITIQDVAARAGVSISTVSRVLNENAPVADETRQAVLSVIEELGYRPNVFAQGLATGQSMTIGVLTQLLSSPFYDSILRGIVEGINGSGYSAIFVDGYWDARKEAQALEMLVSRRVDGLIVLGGQLPESELLDFARKAPMIVIGRSLPELASQCIPLDDFDAAFRATQFLIENGHRRIAHVTGLLSHQDANDRRDGYLAALQQAGIEPDPDVLIEGDYTEPSGILAVEMLLTRGRTFSAIFLANDQMAYGARLALYRRSIRVPEDVSLVGFDDQVPSAFMTPPLTTVGRPPLEIGCAAGQAILHLIKGKPFHLPEFPSRLMVRESVARR